jgi:hypothetical protein
MTKNQSKDLRVMLEIGPKGKKVVAVAPDWPGLERSASTAVAAIEKLQAYIPRYTRVARLARMGPELTAQIKVKVVEEYQGVGSTDFWGISFALSDIDHQPMSDAELKRELSIMKACWKYFDEVRAKVSAEMMKGPRGGGRDRDRIVRHVLASEQDWGKKLRISKPHDPVITDDDGVLAYRDAYCRTIQKFHAEGEMARSWPLRYLIRHTAYHTMDHSWEMEDKDLSD